RNEISFIEFCNQFNHEMRKYYKQFSAEEFINCIESCKIRPFMLQLLKILKQSYNLKIGVITNNWYSKNNSIDEIIRNELSPYVDVFLESRILGINKPDPRIYKLALEKLQVKPHEVVYLDDIGRNLKVPRNLGMKTIKVSNPPTEAIRELEQILGFKLLSKL